jgi:hypothetical protein
MCSPARVSSQVSQKPDSEGRRDNGDGDPQETATAGSDDATGDSPEWSTKVPQLDEAGPCTARLLRHQPARTTGHHGSVERWHASGFLDECLGSSRGAAGGAWPSTGVLMATTS